MKRVIVRYTVKPDQAAKNEELVRAVYDELHRCSRPPARVTGMPTASSSKRRFCALGEGCPDSRAEARFAPGSTRSLPMPA